MRKTYLLIIALLAATPAYASPTQTGATGLINVPSADTLDGGNICIGLWGNYSQYKSEYIKLSSNDPKKHSLTLPVSLTLGVGSFWEFYATYPNLLFNSEEDPSRLKDRTENPDLAQPAQLGTKLRFWGKRNSSFKMAADIFARRRVSEDTELDGITDAGARVIATLKKDMLGFHLYGGYLLPGKRSGTSYQNEILYGGAMEFSPTMRTKTMVELTGNTNRDRSRKDPLEVSVGFQYYISPHLTLNLSGGVGLSDASPQWKGLIGFSTCQGVGTYVKPVPRIGKDKDLKDTKKQEVAKPVKIVPISSLVIRSAAPAPVSKLEVPVDQNVEEVVIRPYGQITIAPQPTAKPAPAPMPKVEPPALPAPEKAVEQPAAVVTAKQLPQEVPVSQLDSEITMIPKNVKADPAELTRNKVEGITPLYGLTLRGEKVAATAAQTADIPETMTVYRKFRFPDVSFEYDQAGLSAEGRKAVAEVAEQLRSDKKWVYLRIDGHTDSIGSVNYNRDLSLKRAIQVAQYLVKTEGIDPSRIFIKGFGKSTPIADNATSEGRRTNRRSELLLLVPKEGN